MGRVLCKRLSIIIFTLIFVLFFALKQQTISDQSNRNNENFFRRHLTEITIDGNELEPRGVSNCSSVEHFPEIPERIRESVFMSLFSCVVIIYLFIGTALICDEFFVPSLEILCDVLKLDPDIAGSTFMAAGSSAPELAVSLIGVFIAEDDIGTGTIIGSSIFNIAFVISICGLFAGRVVAINWWPICCDSVFYFISICLLLTAMYDKNITSVESIAFLSFYVLYILFTAYNKLIKKKLSHILHFKEECVTDAVAYDRLSSGITYQDVVDSPISITIDTHHLTRETRPPCRDSVAMVAWSYVIMPLLLLHSLTVVDCKQEKRRKWFAITFLSSCVWISIYSYVIVWMITIIGFNLHIPDSVMGLVLVSAGASVPDAFASLIVARQGLGDMALTNTIGSNIFDILVCLGLPWFLRTSVIKPGTQVKVISRGLEYSTICCLSTIVFFVVTLHLNKWRLTPKYGIVLMVWYVFIIGLALLFELNVFGPLNPSVC